MTNPNNVVNKNDNVECRNRFFSGFDKRGSEQRFKQYIPVVARLIERYCADAWKMAPFSWEYSFKEFQLCTLFEQWPADRDKRIQLFALALNCPPLVLYNDPERLI